jgi:hypothetical protein
MRTKLIAWELMKYDQNHNSVLISLKSVHLLKFMDV